MALDSNSNIRVVKNTVLLFFRTLIVMFISIYTSRVVLSVLGVEDYGINNVVGGIVSMLSFLNSAMVQASQRYLTYAQGRGDLADQKKVFTTSIRIHLCISLIVLIVLETIGLWYINHMVVVPPERFQAAKTIYQFSVASFILSIFTVPFNASVIAHEKMQIYAYISILAAVLQLTISILLSKLPYDKLISYGFFMMMISLVSFILYLSYCLINFKECRYERKNDWSLFKEMFSFAGWAFLGGFGFVVSGQGVNLVINLFCGPAMNAARSVAFQVSTAVQVFVSSFQQAINPQITKRFAVGHRDSMMRLVRAGSKYTFYILLMCCAPIIARTQYILDLWLVNPPEFSAQFLKLALIMALINSMAGPLTTAMQATGDIKLFQIVVSIIMSLDVVFAYILLKIGIRPYLVTGVSIFSALACLIARIFLLHRLVPFDIKQFMTAVVWKNLCIASITMPSVYLLSLLFDETFINLLLICTLSVLITSIVVYALGMDSFEKAFFINRFRDVKAKLIRR